VGIDFESIAVPLDAEPMGATRADPQLWKLAYLRPPFSDPRGKEALPEISQALVAAVPAGTRWVASFPDRSLY
jgi:hypothetical protein